MVESAATRFSRIAQIVTELSHDFFDGPTTVAGLAEAFGVSENEIALDFTILGDATDNPRGAGLRYTDLGIDKASGVRAKFTEAFRRPLTLNPDEALALAVALGSDPESADNLARLLPRPAEHMERFALEETDDPDGIRVLLLSARQTCNCVEIEYAGPGGPPSSRVIQPHQIVDYEGVAYVIAWCEHAEGERHFRLERILRAKPVDSPFELREELLRNITADDLDNRSGAGDTVTVRFSPVIARWIRERYPKAREQDDGSALVEFTVWNADWLIGHLLQYGAQAEVVGPDRYREMMLEAVAG